MNYFFLAPPLAAFLAGLAAGFFAAALAIVLVSFPRNFCLDHKMQCQTASLCTRPQGTQYVVVYRSISFSCQLFLLIAKHFFRFACAHFENDNWRGFQTRHACTLLIIGQIRQGIYIFHEMIFLSQCPAKTRASSSVSGGRLETLAGRVLSAGVWKLARTASFQPTRCRIQDARGPQQNRKPRF